MSDKAAGPPVPDAAHGPGAEGLLARVAALEAKRAILAETLAGTTEHYRSTFEGCPIPMTLTRVSDRAVTDVNRAFLEILGFRRDQVVGRTTQESGFWADPAERARFFEDLRGGGRVENREVELLDGAGRRRRHLVSARVARIGGEEHVVTWGIDITERIRLEADLRASRESLTQLLHSSPVGISISLVRTGLIVDMNEEFLRILGFAREEAVGRTSTEIGLWVHEGQRDGIVAEFIARGRVSPRPVTMRRRDGTLVTVLFSASPLAMGEEPHTVAWVMDITARLAAEEALRASEERWRTLGENAPVAILTVDRDGTILTFNHSLVGRATQEVVGRSIHDFPLGEGERERSVALLERVFRDGETVSFEIDAPSPGGRRIRMQNTLAPLRGGGEVVGAIGVGVDVTARHEALEALRASEGRWRTLAASAPVVLMTLDGAGDVLTVNRTVTGRDLAEYVGRKAFHFLHPDHRARGQALVESVIATGQAGTGEFPIVTREGAPFWFQVSVAPLPPGPGPERAILVATDIDARRKAEEALRQSEERWRSLVENAPAVITILEGDGTVHSVNQTITGRTRGEVVGGNAFPLLPAESREKAREQLAGVISSGRPLTFRLPVHGAAGELRWFEHRLAPLGDGSPPARAICVSTDITPQVQAEASLRESEERFRDIVSSLGDWVWESDDQGRLTYCSPQVEQILGYTPEEMRGKTPLETCVPEERERQGHGLAKLMRSPRPIRGLEVWHLRKDGRRVCLAVNGFPVSGPGGALRGFRGVIQDVTDRRREEEERVRMLDEVHQARRVESLGVLAGGIAHDFNNLLAAVLGNADLALAELAEGARARPLVEQIHKAAVHAAELTRQMLTYAGRGTVAIERVDVSETVRDMSQLLGASIPKKVDLSFELADGLPAVEADPAQLRQIVMNLVVNGAEAAGDAAGRVMVRTGPGGDAAAADADLVLGGLERGRQGVLLEVADTGCGMDPDTLRRAFDPFFSTKFTGRGLGLAAVRGIVLRHKGALAVRSRPGGGSRFRVLFPEAGPAPAAAPAPAPGARSGAADPPAAWRGSGAVLVVDDEEQVRTMAARMLAALGFTALAAAGGREAAELVAAGGAEIRAVLLDLTMPEMDGRETLARLRALRGDLPVILCSGYDLLEHTERYADLALSGFLQKPYRVAELASALRTALGEG
jgi:PAS domain S-box-containing protein